jgi:hypothetical protein
LQPTFHGTRPLLSLSTGEDDGLGKDVQVWELEPAGKVIQSVALTEPAGFEVADKLV